MEEEKKSDRLQQEEVEESKANGAENHPESQERHTGDSEDDQIMESSHPNQGPDVQESNQ